MQLQWYSWVTAGNPKLRGYILAPVGRAEGSLAGEVARVVRNESGAWEWTITVSANPGPPMCGREPTYESAMEAAEIVLKPGYRPTGPSIDEALEHLGKLPIDWKSRHGGAPELAWLVLAIEAQIPVGEKKSALKCPSCSTLSLEVRNVIGFGADMVCQRCGWRGGRL